MSVNKKDVEELCASFDSLPLHRKLNVLFALTSSPIIAGMNSTLAVKEIIKDEKSRKAVGFKHKTLGEIKAGTIGGWVESLKLKNGDKEFFTEKLTRTQEPSREVDSEPEREE